MTGSRAYATAALPGIGGRLRVRPSDFIVEELPLYEPCGEGEHLYLLIEKQGVSSDDLVRAVMSHFGVKRAGVGVAGRKDKRAVTRQLVSVHLPGRSEDEFGMLRHEGLAVLWVDRHTNKLRMGHLAGNRFNIRIRDVAMPDVLAAQRVLRELERVGVPNFFGPQRFGAAGDNHLRGAALLRGEAGPRRPDVQRLLLNAVQSAAFNSVLDQRIRIDKLAALEPGDLAWVHASGAVFAVDAGEAAGCETGRRLAAFEISPSGPLWGASMTQAKGAVADLELSAIDRLGLEPSEFAHPLATRVIPGARRPLRVPMNDVDVEGGIDEHGGYVRVAFDLPSGAYATSVLREIMKNDDDPADRGSAGDG